MQPERGLGDQAQRPERPGEQLADVIAGHVLDDLAAGLGHPAVRAHHGDPDQQVARRAVAQPPRPGHPGREHPADRRPRGRGTSSDSCWPASPSTPASCSSLHAGLDAGYQSPAACSSTRSSLPCLDHQVAAARRQPPGQPRPAAPRHDRQVQLAAARIVAAASATVPGPPPRTAGRPRPRPRVRPRATAHAAASASAAAPGAGPVVPLGVLAGHSRSACPAATSGCGPRLKPGTSPHSRGVG